MVRACVAPADMARATGASKPSTNPSRDRQAVKVGFSEPAFQGQEPNRDAVHQELLLFRLPQSNPHILSNRCFLCIHLPGQLAFALCRGFGVYSVSWWRRLPCLWQPRVCVFWASVWQEACLLYRHCATDHPGCSLYPHHSCWNIGCLSVRRLQSAPEVSWLRPGPPACRHCFPLLCVSALQSGSSQDFRLCRCRTSRILPCFRSQCSMPRQ
mmetsp:Transcript_11545/g.28802  ORF Transcript_11545/g.28802 Transcript_11545/m.28802 type:complete len:212 (+) Transcript_11545:2055-2690(+)